ncbi:MAG: hypothetical protein HRU09_18330 [Oligoflexales bacterium]|nr:hypothetical protein [Oligoflexales bacterium]
MDIAELNQLKSKIVSLFERLKRKDPSVNFDNDMKPLLDSYWMGLGVLTEETNETLNKVDSLNQDDAEIILEELKNLREFALTVNEMVLKYKE